MKGKIAAYFLLLALIFSCALVGGCKAETTITVNAVVKVEFLDSENPFTATDDELLKNAFSGQENSLKNFIEKNSNGKETVNSQMIATVKILKSVDYFMPKYEYDYTAKEYVIVNELGYDNRYFDEDGNPSTSGKQSAERFFREQEFVSLATQLASAQIENLGGGVTVENLTLVPCKLNRGVVRGSLFWAHQAKVFKGSVEDLSAVYHLGDAEGGIKDIKLADKSINGYILIPYAFISDGKTANINTLCHEYMHALGAPEMYSLGGGETAVGEFDLLGGEDTSVPNLSLSYIRAKMGWLDESQDIKAIAVSGEYELTATEIGGGVKAYKIALPDYYETGECFYVEYRALGEGSLSSESTDGVIVYRVNEKNGRINSLGEVGAAWYGNAYKTEVYIFRFDREMGSYYETRNEITKNGICYATLSNKVGYTTFGSQSGGKNSIVYSNGKNTGVVVEFLSKADGKARVKITLPDGDYSSALANEGVYEGYGNRYCLQFGKRGQDTIAYALYTSQRIDNPNPQDLISGKYGEVSAYQTAMLKVDLPKFDGYEKFVYLCYKTGDELSAVKTFKISGVKNLDATVVIIIAAIVGFGVPALFFAVVKKVAKGGKTASELEKTGDDKKNI